MTPCTLFWGGFTTETYLLAGGRRNVWSLAHWLSAISVLGS